jgi:hypothetical protein
MMSVCQEARLALVPDWPCLYYPTVVMVAWEETGDDETTRRRDNGRRQHASAWALGRRRWNVRETCSVQSLAKSASPPHSLEDSQPPHLAEEPTVVSCDRMTRYSIKSSY